MKYEYLTLPVRVVTRQMDSGRTYDEPDAYSDEELNAIGAEGWAAVSARVTDDGVVWALMMRGRAA